jgi:hypothetical protein
MSYKLFSKIKKVLLRGSGEDHLEVRKKMKRSLKNSVLK